MKKRVKWRAAVSFAWKNADALVLMGVGVVAFGADVIGEPFGQPTLIALSLAMLSGVAFMFLRDRRDMTNLGALEELARSAPKLKALEEMAETWKGNRPYEVVDMEETTWDITSGHDATYLLEQNLRFAQDRVAVVEHRTGSNTGSSTVTECSAESKHGGGGWKEAVHLSDFGTSDGHTYLFSVGREFHYGDKLSWRVSRVLRDRFPEGTERVTSKTRENLRAARVMKVIWPERCVPYGVKLFIDETFVADLEIKDHSSGRKFVERMIPPGQAGKKAVIEWSWDRDSF